MKNKFLEKYPQLREPEVGDTIEIVKILSASGKLLLFHSLYKRGDTGKIIRIRYDPFYKLEKIVCEILHNNTKKIIDLYPSEFKIIKYNNEK